MTTRPLVALASLGILALAGCSDYSEVAEARDRAAFCEAAETVISGDDEARLNDNLEVMGRTAPDELGDDVSTLQEVAFYVQNGGAPPENYFTAAATAADAVQTWVDAHCS